MSEKYIVAVSGGVDSVCLLDMLARNTIYHLPSTKSQLIVAHFDHGIRPDSADDAKFVEGLAKKYGLKFESKREELGSGASEELARNRRYAFLRDLANQYDAKVVTAHHGDDAVETVAINTVRGTGWRGLAALDSDIIRPLLQMTKQDLLSYARNHNLQWREDSTNQDMKYLRNSMRKRISNQVDKKQVLDLRSRQVAIKHQIDDEVGRVVGEGPEYSRYFFINADRSVALECLRHITNARLTRPQLERLLVMVKTAKAGSDYEAGDGILVNFTSRNFSL